MSEGMWQISIHSPSGAQVSVSVRATDYNDALQEASYYEFSELEQDDDL